MTGSLKPKHLSVLLILVLLLLVSGCAPKPDLLEQMTGVWRAKKAGLVLIDLQSAQKHLGFRNEDASKDSVVLLSVGEIDSSRRAVNVRVTLPKGDIVTWTIQVTSNPDDKISTLSLTLHTGLQDDLSFVRAFSELDLAFLRAHSSASVIGLAGAADTARPLDITGQYAMGDGGSGREATLNVEKLSTEKIRISISGTGEQLRPGGPNHWCEIGDDEPAYAVLIENNAVYYRKHSNSKLTFKFRKDHVSVDSPDGGTACDGVDIRGVYRKHRPKPQWPR